MVIFRRCLGTRKILGDNGLKPEQLCCLGSAIERHAFVDGVSDPVVRQDIRLRIWKTSCDESGLAQGSAVGIRTTGWKHRSSSKRGTYCFSGLLWWNQPHDDIFIYIFRNGLNRRKLIDTIKNDYKSAEDLIYNYMESHGFSKNKMAIFVTIWDLIHEKQNEGIFNNLEDVFNFIALMAEKYDFDLNKKIDYKKLVKVGNEELVHFMKEK